MFAYANTKCQAHSARALAGLQTRAIDEVKALGDACGALPASEEPRDAYLLSVVLHGFSDTSCRTILANLARVAGSSGAHILVMEIMVPFDRADLTSASFDMQMLMGTQGKVRIHDEWAKLFASSGLQWRETVDLTSFAKIMVLDVPA